MEIEALEELLRKAWSKETSADPSQWTKENPAWGQCAVTALVVNDYFGGRLVWSSAKLPTGQDISHYFNETANKQTIDLTRCQFPEGTVIPDGIDKTKGFPTTREYVLSFPVTLQRYNLLKEIL